MFNGKSKSGPPVNSVGNSTSLIGTGTTLHGDLTCNADLRIDGILNGNINSTAKIIIGANGLVEGDIIGQQADIHGKVIGSIVVKDLLQLKGNCVVNGNIQAGNLQIDTSASFNGQCQMTAPEVIVTPSAKEQKQDLKMMDTHVALTK